MNSTFKYYQKNYSDLLIKYDFADMSELNKIFLKYITPKSTVLDLGFGSGRDIKFLFNNGFKVYGLDNCKSFINSFSNKNIIVSETTLPNINLNNFDIKEFDSIISIATIMHLNKQEISELIKNIYSILKDEGIVIISYSTIQRVDDERFFEDIDYAYIKNKFEEEKFVETYNFINDDGMGRDIKWITQVFKK